jgi:CheY-like chemotaxis protein
MKGKAFIIHWNVQEAEQYAQLLYEDGWSVEFEAVDGRRAFDLIGKDQPDVVLIYLSRLHIQGRAVAVDLRESSETESIPIVFVDGKQKAVQKAMSEVPDAIPATQDEILGVILRFRSRRKASEGGPGLRITDIKTGKLEDLKKQD